MRKNTICLWYDKDAEDAARFYAATFPDSKVTAVHKAPGDFPGGKAGDVLTVEFTVLGVPCHRPQRRPGVQAQRGVLLPGRNGRPGGNGPLLERDRRQRRPGERVRLVQGPLGPLLADHPAHADRGAGGRRRRGQARVRRHDDDAEDRRRHDRRRAAGLSRPKRVSSAARGRTPRPGRRRRPARTASAPATGRPPRRRARRCGPRPRGGRRGRRSRPAGRRRSAP